MKATTAVSHSTAGLPTDLPTSAPLELPQPGQKYSLLDSNYALIGEVAIQMHKNGWYFGAFTSAPGFEKVKALFEEHTEIVNDQVLSLIDDVEQKIAALGLHLLVDGGGRVPPICDVQIGNNSINFHVQQS
ncbi:MAG: hypothetical protein L0Y70_02575 [Gemmataceae bacterium]|nr:hypothetical protein [Gemmataceae bacterium]